MPKYLVVIVFLCMIQTIKAQEKSPIQTDRPDQTESPSITPKRQLQMEFGFVYEGENKTTSNFTTPNILTKFGLSDKVELRLITDYDIRYQQANDVTIKKKQFNPTLIGCKINLFDEKKCLPKTSLLLHVGLPFLASKEFNKDNVFTTFRFLMQHTLSNKMSFSYNLGAEWDGVTTAPAGVYTLSLGYGISSKIGSYVELFGSAQGKKAEHNYDMGFTYLINSNFQLDISGGFGVNKNAPDYFVGCGLSFRTGD